MAGAGKAIEEAASEDVKSAYETLKGKVLSLFRGNRPAELAILDTATAPQEAEPVLTRELEAVRNRVSPETVQTAQMLMSLLDASGAAEGKYDLREARGVQIGNGNTQTNTFM